MGNTQSGLSKINYEDVQYILNNTSNFLLITTLDENVQSCLIPNTIPLIQEEKLINELIDNGKFDTNILIYGMNCNDDKIHVQQQKLYSIGFKNIYLYLGGMFEWLCLQDIYGADTFPTTTNELDILKYKPTKTLNKYLIAYSK